MIPREEHEARLKLYNQGLNDTEMGHALYLSPATVHRWRRINGLPSNFKSPRMTGAELEEIWRMYRAGETDWRIGKATGRPASTIYNWRKRNGLPKNSPKGRKKRNG